MLIDILALVFALMGAWSGWMSGSLPELARLAVLFLAGLLTRVTIGPIAGFFLRAAPEATVETAVGICFFVGFIVFYGILFVATRQVIDELGFADTRGQVDKFLGAPIGAVRGLGVGFVLVIALFMMTVGSGSPRLNYAGSKFFAEVGHRDFLARVADDVADAEAIRDRPRLRGWERAGFVDPRE